MWLYFYFYFFIFLHDAIHPGQKQNQTFKLDSSKPNLGPNLQSKLHKPHSMKLGFLLALLMFLGVSYNYKNVALSKVALHACRLGSW